MKEYGKNIGKICLKESDAEIYTDEGDDDDNDSEEDRVIGCR